MSKRATIGERGVLIHVEHKKVHVVVNDSEAKKKVWFFFLINVKELVN